MTLAHNQVMAVLGFQEMFLAFLQFLNDGKARHTREITELTENHFQLSDADRPEMISSGQSTKVANRVGWTRTHLHKAGLIAPESRGVYKITDNGREIVANSPPVVDLRYLDTIPSHKNWFHAPRGAANIAPVPTTEQTPEEQLANLVEDFKAELVDEIQEMLVTVNPFRFEQIVLDLLSAMGYGGSREEAARVTKQSNDEGIDGIINEDRLGLDIIYVQAKRWQTTVGRPDVQSFVGALAGKQAHKGVFITETIKLNASIQITLKKLNIASNPTHAPSRVRHSMSWVAW